MNIYKLKIRNAYLYILASGTFDAIEKANKYYKWNGLPLPDILSIEYIASAKTLHKDESPEALEAAKDIFFVRDLS